MPLLTYDRHISREEALRRITEAVSRFVREASFGSHNAEDVATYDAASGRIRARHQDVVPLTLSLARGNHRARIMGILRILSTAHALVLNNERATQRDVYYRLQTHFSNVEACYRAVRETCNVLRLSRFSINITTYVHRALSSRSFDS